MARRGLTPFLLISLIISLTGGGAAQTPNMSPIAVALRAAPPEAAHPAFEDSLPVLNRYYAARDFRPIWTDGASLSPAGQSVMTEILRAAEDGLNPADYLLSRMSAVASRQDSEAMANREVLMSLAVVRFARDLGWGVTLPSEVDRDNVYDRRPFDAEAVLNTIATAPDAGVALRGFAPQSFVYRLMKEGLARLRDIERHGGWTTASDGPTLRPGDSGPRVQQLRKLLVERGDLQEISAEGDKFDAELTTALKQFQDRHGLKTDGVYGKQAVSEYNVPLATRILQMRLGLERLRWLPQRFTGRRIAVNLADFKAYVFDDDKVAFETRAVIGKQFSATPMFTGLMTYLVINPYWNVPPSITRREILPKIKADPNYLAKNHMEMEGGSVRQTPGPWNSLGRFKFMFPNTHNIYLHDTPARALFNEADRAFSHGCVRLEKPAELAALLLAGQGWTPERIKSVVEGGRSTTVTLDTPIPVAISYATAFLDPDGLIHFRRDVYGRDKKLIDALEHRNDISGQ